MAVAGRWVVSIGSPGFQSFGTVNVTCFVAGPSRFACSFTHRSMSSVSRSGSRPLRPLKPITAGSLLAASAVITDNASMNSTSSSGSPTVGVSSGMNPLRWRRSTMRWATSLADR